MAVILVGKAGERKNPLPRGACAKIARRLRPKVSSQAVWLVATGQTKSARISAAIERFLRDREGVAA